MSLVDVNIDIKELEAVIGRLSQHVEVGLPIIGETLSTAINELIQSEGATGTEGQWEPFSENTLLIHPLRNKNGQLGKLLQNTGLLASMQTEQGPDWVEVASPADYATYQMDGVNPNPWRNMGPIPARNFLAVDMGRVLEEAADLIAAEIAEP